MLIERRRSGVCCVVVVATVLGGVLMGGFWVVKLGAAATETKTKKENAEGRVTSIRGHNLGVIIHLLQTLLKHSYMLITDQHLLAAR